MAGAVTLFRRRGGSLWLTVGVTLVRDILSPLAHGTWTAYSAAMINLLQGDVSRMAEEPRGPAVREQEEVREQYGYRPPAPEPTRTSPLAIASLATGIAAWLVIPVIGAIAAVVTGFLAQNEIRESRGRLTGSALATAGLVLGWVQLGLIIVGLIFIGLFAGTVT